MLIAFAVGVLIGAVGVGGILLIPALATFARLGIHEAMATALFTFIFTGLAGTALFQRKGSIDWRITIPVCWGAVLFAFAGAWLNSVAPPQTLLALLAAVIILAGVDALASWQRLREPALKSRPAAQRALLAGIGAASGLGSGVTGVGGPALSVPLMLLFGFPALASIGASQVVQIIAAASGTAGNLSFGSINFKLAAPVTILEIAGVFAGTRLAHAVHQAWLRRLVAVVCVLVGSLLIAQALGWA